MSSSGDHITKDGVYPFFQYIIKEQGKLLIGDLACANCHNRLTEDDNGIIRARENVAFDNGIGNNIIRFDVSVDLVNHQEYQLSAAPWANKLRKFGF